MSQKRYAIYYAPEQGSDLDLFGQTWLARDAATGVQHDRLKIDGISDEDFKKIIQSVAHYGFHGTLKPPFYLTFDKLESMLMSDLEAFAVKENPFLIPELQVTNMGRYMALMPRYSSEDLHGLADRCVRNFDAYRKPESDQEMDKRRKAGLNSLQEQYLVTWGYPYVLKAFRFHLTLAGPILDDDIRHQLFKALEKQLESVSLDNLLIDSVCLFSQEDRSKPFLFHSRYQFGGNPI